MGRRHPPSPSSFVAFAFLIWCHASLVVTAQQNAPAPAQVRVGVILNTASPIGRRRQVCLQMAVDDYYAAHPSSRTRVALRFRDSGRDVLGAASAAVDLIMNEQVQAIIGPQTSAEAEFVAHIGCRTNVTILSYSATSPELSTAQTPFFVRTAVSDSAQAEPIAAVLAKFRWHAAVIVYEDSRYGAGILPAMADELQGVSARIMDRVAVPINANDDRIDQELHKFKENPTRVFIVHMSHPLAFRFFRRARNAGMMSKEYAWIATDGVGGFTDALKRKGIDAMEGVVSLRPYVEVTEQVKNFSARFWARLRRERPNDATNTVHDPTVMALWAYDTVWAIAKAAEAARITSPAFQFQTTPQRRAVVTDLDRLGVSATGETLLKEVLATNFTGLAGKFRLVDGQLQLPSYEIVNIIRTKGAETVGFWIPKSRISHAPNAKSHIWLNKQILWPGGSSSPPKGWVVSPDGQPLRVVVPGIHAFKPFVNVSDDSTTGSPKATGFCIEVFQEVMRNLPYKVEYRYKRYDGSWESYEKLVSQVVEKKADIVVGDVTITASRSAMVDFTMPFTESGWSMVVPVRTHTSTSMWVFLKPLSTSLWLASLSFFFFTGFVVWLIEHRINQKFRGTPCQQFGLIFYFAFSTLVFSHKEKLVSNLSRLVVTVWVLVVLILTTSYIASLTSMLTVQKLQPTVTDIRELQRRGDFIGYPDGSFLKTSLQNMGFDRTKMRNYSTLEQYAEALSKGPANGGVAAVFDEIPYLKMFLSQPQYCDAYTMAGPVYKAEGFGFVFPKGSPMTADVSHQILKLAEGEKMVQIEKKWFGEPGMCHSHDGKAAQSSSSLSFQSFGGLFLITGVVSGLMLLIFLYRERDGLRAKAESRIPSLRWLSAWMSRHDSRDMRSPSFNKTPSWNNDKIRDGRDANGLEHAASEEDSTSPPARK